MILRKPYTFFIKYFRFFHIILSLMMIFLAYKTQRIFSFYNSYISSSQSLNASGITDTLYSTFSILLPLMIAIISIIVLIVLYNKNKKYAFYVFITIFYLLMFVLTLYSRNISYQLEEGAVDLRILKSIKDFYFIGYIMQFTFIMITTIRAIGFDIKKFDFVSDLKKLNITDEDREEFEVSINFDTNKLKRNFNRNVRSFKYFYKEKKRLINSLILIAICFIGLLVFLNMREQLNFINEGESFSVNGFSYKVESSYITNNDYKGNTISEDTYLIIVNLNIANNNLTKKSLTTSYYELMIDDKIYYHTNKYNSKIFDLGKGYNGENIDGEEKYAFIYEIAKEDLEKNAVFRVFVGTDANNKKNYKKVKITPLNYLKEEKTAGLGETITFERGIFKNSIINITNIEMDKSFTLNYNFCINAECFDSVEIIKGRINSNYDKAIIKIDGDFEGNYNLCDFLYNFGKIRYINSGGEMAVKRLNVGIVKPVKVNLTDTCFLEMPTNILDSNNIVLEVNVRNEIIKYAIK